ncbi:MAG: ATP-binding protein [Bacteroidia bacterium]
MDSPEVFKNIIARERKARKAAEAIIEEKSLELYLANQKLIQLNESLEDKILARTEEIERSRQELKIAKERAESATIAKTQFLSNMSHEIRTPLNAIMGMIGLIIEDSKDELAQNHANSIKYSAENLLKIINEILDLSKIEAGKLTFEKIAFRLDSLIDSLKDIFQHKANDKNIDLLVEFTPETPLSLFGDQVKLNQILVNLVGNAFKFTEKGEVKIRIHARDIKAKKCILCVEVSDTGIGIPKSKQSRIFESFSQANNSTTRLYGGTGLGLAITKNLVELQNGTISLESEMGVGTSFTIELPIEIAEVSDINPKKTKRSHNYEVLKGIKVLVVEDIAVNRLFMKHVFRRKNIPVEFAINGKEAISILAKKSFDIVFMDLHMPIMDGWEATRIIRSADSPVLDNHVPIIALSADAFKETQSEVNALGMDGFITKPVNIHILYDTLIELFSKKTAD